MSVKRVLWNYRRVAREKGVAFTLTLKDFTWLIAQPCHYCGKPPLQKDRNFLYNGLDRKDNKKGYTRTNVVPACKICNSIKGQYLTYGEMLLIGSTLIGYRKTRPGP